MSASSYPTLSLVLPVIYLIKKHVNAAITADTSLCSTHTTRFAQAMKPKLDACDTLMQLEEIKLAAFVDSGIKSLLQDIEIPTQNIKAVVVEEWDSFHDARSQSLMEKPDSTSTPATANGSFRFSGPFPPKGTAASSPGADEPFASNIDRWMFRACLEWTVVGLSANGFILTRRSISTFRS